MNEIFLRNEFPVDSCPIHRISIQSSCKPKRIITAFKSPIIFIAVNSGLAFVYSFEESIIRLCHVPGHVFLINIPHYHSRHIAITRKKSFVLMFEGQIYRGVSLWKTPKFNLEADNSDWFFSQIQITGWSVLGIYSGPKLFWCSVSKLYWSLRHFYFHNLHSTVPTALTLANLERGLMNDDKF